MRNIDKKWFLFAMATVVSFYGICHTLLNFTFAFEYKTPIDLHFEDMNFYKCIVDSYNLEFFTDISYNDIMDYDKLNKLSILICNQNDDVLEQDKIVSLKGIEILTSLEYLALANNNISVVDLSNNLELRSLDISYNDLYEVNLSKNEKLSYLKLTDGKFIKDVYVYNSGNIKLDDGIKLNSNLISNDIKWYMEDKNGVSVYYGKSNLDYEVINNVIFVDITSDKYVIDKENNYIYVNDLNDFNIQDIRCNYDNVILELYLNNKTYVKYNDNILKEFELVELPKDA